MSEATETAATVTSVAKELGVIAAKSAAETAAAYAGAVVLLVAVGASVNTVKSLKTKRAAKKATETVLAAV